MPNKVSILVCWVEVFDPNYRLLVKIQNQEAVFKAEEPGFGMKLIEVQSFVKLV